MSGKFRDQPRPELGRECSNQDPRIGPVREEPLNRMCRIPFCVKRFVETTGFSWALASPVQAVSICERRFGVEEEEELIVGVQKPRLPVKRASKPDEGVIGRYTGAGR